MTYTTYKDPNGYLYRAWTNEEGCFHRDDGPAKICYYPDESVKYEIFLLNNRVHRIDGPAWISYSKSGLINSELYYINGAYLGKDNVGFWALWDRLTKDERHNQLILKSLMRYS